MFTITVSPKKYSLQHAFTFVSSKHYIEFPFFDNSAIDSIFTVKCNIFHQLLCKKLTLFETSISNVN